MIGEIAVSFLMLAGSLFVLIKGSDWFIDSAEKIGLSVGISQFVIGVTIIAFGTSLPELASSISAVVKGNSEIVANVVIGSNTTNILLVLGILCLIQKDIRMDYDIMDIDMPLLVGSGFLLWFIFKDLEFSFFESLLLIAGLILFLFNSLSGKKSDEGLRPKIGWREIGLLILGGVLVTYGADFTVRSVTSVADKLDINEGIVAATLLALGTSLPEVVVSISAATKGKGAIAVGNVLGSNLFNTYAIIAIPSYFGKFVVPAEILDFGLPFMIVVTMLFALISLGSRITRWEGIMLLIFYIFFIYQSFQ